MQTLLKIVLWIAGVFFALLLILSGVIYWKKDEIIRSYQEEFNKQLEGEFTYSEVGLSLFSSFPQIGISVHDPTLTSDVHQPGDTLVNADEVDLSFGLWEVLSGSGTVTIREVMLHKPRVHVAIDSSGKANYDLWISTDEQPAAPDTAQSAYNNFRIDYFSVDNGQLSYDDATQALDLMLRGFNLEAAGTVGSSIYSFEISSEIKDGSLAYDGIQYFNQAELSWDGPLEYNLDSSALSFEENEIVLNALKLQGGGQFVLLPDRYKMDLKVSTAGEDIRQIVSLIPAVYADGLNQIQTDGTLSITSSVKGEYGPGPEDYPAIAVDGSVQNGQFQYEGASADIRDIQAQLNIEKPQGRLNQTTIRIPTFSMQIDEYPLSGSLYAEQLMDNPAVKGSLKTDLNLSSVREVLASEDVRKMSGQITADVSFDFQYDQIERKDYRNIDFSGMIQAQNTAVDYGNYPAVSATSLRVNLSPAMIKTQMDDLNYGASDFSGLIDISDPLPWYFNNKILDLRADVSGDRWLVDEWMPAEEPQAQEANREESSAEQAPSPSPDSLYPVQADVKIDVQRIDYTDYRFENVLLDANYSDDRLQLDKATAQWDGNKINAGGTLANIQAYALTSGVLSGSLNLQMDRLNLDKFTEGASTEQSVDQQEPVEEPSEQPSYALPENIDLNVDFSTEAFQYGKITGNNFSANASLVNQVLNITEASLNGLGGTINLSGKYDTGNPAEPRFAFQYDLSSMDISSLFSAVETFGLFLPIGQRMEGRLHSGLSISGVLDQQLAPIYEKLDASGSINTDNASLPKLDMFNQMDDRLGFDAFRDLDIRDIKAKFDINNGRLQVEKIPFQAGDIDMSIEGQQYLNRSMDYILKAMIPREMITSTQIGQKADRGFEWLQEQSQNAGFSIDEVDEIALNIHITGTPTEPKFNIKFGGSSKNPVKSQVQRGIDTVKTRVKNKVDTVKEEVKDQAKETIDTVKKELEKNAKNIIEEQVTGKSDTTTEKTKKDIEKEVKNKADSLKKKAKKWNPFGN